MLLQYTFKGKLEPTIMDKLKQRLAFMGVQSESKGRVLKITGPANLTIKEALKAGAIVGLTQSEATLSSKQAKVS